MNSRRMCVIGADENNIIGGGQLNYEKQMEQKENRNEV